MGERDVKSGYISYMCVGRGGERGEGEGKGGKRGEEKEGGKGKEGGEGKGKFVHMWCECGICWRERGGVTGGEEGKEGHRERMRGVEGREDRQMDRIVPSITPHKKGGSVHCNIRCSPCFHPPSIQHLYPPELCCPFT